MRLAVVLALLAAGWLSTARAADLDCLGFQIPGKGGPVRSVSLSPDGLLAAADGSPNVSVWDARTGAVVAIMEGIGDKVTRVAFGPDGGHLMLGLEDGQLLIRETRSWKAAGDWEKHTGPIMALAFAPDGRKAASGGDDRIVRVHDPVAGTCLLRLEGHRRAVRAVAFTPDGRTLVSCGGDKVQVWDATSGQPIRALGEDQAGGASLAISPDGLYVAVGHPEDSSGSVWELATGRRIARLEGDKAEIAALLFGGDRDSLVTLSSDGRLRRWKMPFESQSTGVRGHHATVLCLTASSDGRILASGDAGGRIVVWSDGRPIGGIRGRGSELHAVAFDARGDSVTAVEPASRQGSSGTVWRSWPAIDASSATEWIPNVTFDRFSLQAYSANRETRAIANRDGVLLSHRKEDEWHRGEWVEIGRYVVGMGLTPDGRTLVLATNDRAHIQLRDTATGVEKASVAVSTGAGRGSVGHMDLSPDGKRAAATYDHRAVAVVDLETEKLLLWKDREINRRGMETGVNPYGIAFLGNDRVASLSTEGIQVWDIATGSLLGAFWSDSNWHGDRIAGSPDGRSLAVGGSWKSNSKDESGALVWAIDQNGSLSRTPRTAGGYAGSITQLAFSPDGQKLAVADSDGVLRLWSVGNVQPTRRAPAVTPLDATLGPPPPQVLELIKLLKNPDVVPATKLERAVVVTRQFGERSAPALTDIMTLLDQLEAKQRGVVVSMLARMKGPAILHLGSLTSHPDVGIYALGQLRQIGPDARPAGPYVLKAIADDYRIPFPAVLPQSDHLQAAVAALQPIGVEPGKAVPWLRYILDTPQRSRAGYHYAWEAVAKKAMEQLAAYGPDSQAAVPSLIALITVSDVNNFPMLAEQAMETLGAIGPGAQAALPTLRFVIARESGYNSNLKLRAAAAIRLIQVGKG